MTTDQTIDGVPREHAATLSVLVETFRDSLHRGKQPTFSAGDLKHFITAMVELRALLDAPAKHDDDLAKTYKTYEGQTVRIGRDGGIELVQDELAKPYGYMYHPDGRKDDEFFIYDAPKDRVPDHRGEYWTATPLYTEHPAPVAVALPERLAQNTFYSDGWNACLDEVTRLNTKE